MCTNRTRLILQKHSYLCCSVFAEHELTHLDSSKVTVLKALVVKDIGVPVKYVHPMQISLQGKSNLITVWYALGQNVEKAHCSPYSQWYKTEALNLNVKMLQSMYPFTFYFNHNKT